MPGPEPLGVGGVGAPPVRFAGGRGEHPHRWQTRRPVGPRRPGMVRVAGVHPVLTRPGRPPRTPAGPPRPGRPPRCRRPARPPRPASGVPRRTAVGSCPARPPRRSPAGRYAAGARRTRRGAGRRAPARRAPPGGRTPGRAGGTGRTRPSAAAAASTSSDGARVEVRLPGVGAFPAPPGSPSAGRRSRRASETVAGSPAGQCPAKRATSPRSGAAPTQARSPPDLPSSARSTAPRPLSALPDATRPLSVPAVVGCHYAGGSADWGISMTRDVPVSGSRDAALRTQLRPAGAHTDPVALVGITLSITLSVVLDLSNAASGVESLLAGLMGITISLLVDSLARAERRFHLRTLLDGPPWLVRTTTELAGAMREAAEQHGAPGSRRRRSGATSSSGCRPSSSRTVGSSGAATRTRIWSARPAPAYVGSTR